MPAPWAGDTPPAASLDWLLRLPVSFYSIPFGIAGLASRGG